MYKTVKFSFKVIAGLLAAVLLVWMLVHSQRLYLKKAYPVKYSQYVEKYSQEYNLDPLFVYSIIRTESDFIESAQSSVGARGLMQFTEETFEWVKSRLKDSESTFDSIYDAKTSVRYGAYLIWYLKDTLGTEENVLCGYHAGINRAKIWIADDEICENGKIITEKIPYPDTKQYVNKVMEAYKMYQKLY